METGHGFWPGSARGTGGEGAYITRGTCCSLKGPVMWAAIQKTAEPLCFLGYGPLYSGDAFSQKSSSQPLTSFTSWDFWQQGNGAHPDAVRYQVGDKAPNSLKEEKKAFCPV